MALTTPVASLILTDAIALARQLAFDMDPLNYALTDVQWTTEINNVYEVWYEANNKRLTQLNGSNAWGGQIGAQTVAGRSALGVATNILKWANMYYIGTTDAAGDSNLGAELEQLSLPDIIAAQVSLGQAAVPSYYAVLKLNDQTFLNTGKWGLYLAPMPNTAIYCGGFCLKSPGLYGTTGTDTIDCTEAESRIIVTAASARACERLGKSPQMVESLWRMVPGDTQAILRAKASVEAQPKNWGQN